MEHTPGPARVVAVRRLRGGRASLVLDDGRNLLISEGARLASGLEPGAELNGSILAGLGTTETGDAAHEEALRMLARRARSAAEVSRQLSQKGFTSGVIDAEIERLRQVGLLDDDAFARAWVAERGRLAPRSRRMLRSELRQRGIGTEQAESAVAGIDDREVATALARRRAERVEAGDYRSFATRIGGYLLRRGFDHETAEAAVRAAWNQPGMDEAD